MEIISHFAECLELVFQFVFASVPITGRIALTSALPSASPAPGGPRGGEKIPLSLAAW